MVKRRRNRHEVDEYVAPDDSTAHVENTSWEERHTQYVIGDPSTKLSRVKTHITILHDVAEQSLECAPTNEDSSREWGDCNIPENQEDQVCELEAVGLGDISGTTQSRPRRTRLSNPLADWIPHIDEYVDEFLRLEGRGDCINQAECAQITCHNSVISSFEGFRCLECHDLRLFCHECLVKFHSDSNLPLHRIQAWNGNHFISTTLKALGLRVQLGHSDSSSCSNPENTFNDDFTIIDSDGLHQISLDYCGCQQAGPKRVQLLRARLFPSTVVDPKTAATFRVLETFQMLSFTSKVSAYEYYRSLARRTDNTGTSPPPDRYHAFLRIMREWRHARLLKRMGRGHSASGASGTAEGELAVQCPACPVPAINLPSDWKQRPQSEQWLYSLFIGIDANFRLKRMNVSTEERDPGLNHGYAYVVENTKFTKYLEQYDSKISSNDKSTCHNHDAIKLASMRGGKGTAATGVGTAECSRHDMKRPTAVGDLQKGERYVNIDYIFLSSLERNPPPSLVVSYDIACQWSLKLAERCRIYPSNILSSQPDLDITFLVPKFHLPAHVSKCQVDYSFNLIPGVGRTDGEAPERGWSESNAMAASTKEMGPGSRRDTLDDHFGDRNWGKITHMAETFVRKCEEAVEGRQEHVNAFIAFNSALPLTSTEAWTKLCKTWEADRSQPNPFERPAFTLSNADVRLRLAEEEAKEIELGSREVVHESVSASMLVYQGLEFEESQHHLSLDIASLGSHSTSLQHAKVLERSNSLRRRIDAWIDIQHLYVPSIAVIRARADQQGGGKPVAVQNIDLLLPSTLLEKYSVTFLQYEWQLRLTHAEETLNDLRSLLLMRSMMYKSKDRHMRGQRQQTRSQGLLNGIERRINAAAGRYRRIREALVRLSTPLLESSWRTKLHHLNEGDLTGLTSMDDSGSEGRKKLSWIWKVQGMEMDDEKNTHIALQIEWCRARARAHRWQEECLLLNEEMRRVLSFFKWQADDWRQKAFEHETMLPATENVEPLLAAANKQSQEIIREGKVAYAYRQANIRDKMRAHFSMKWRDLPKRLLSMDNGDATTRIECH